jgi:hypothetical protein
MKGNNRKFPLFEEIQNALENGAQSLCIEIPEIASSDQLRDDFEKQYGKMSEQEYFECKQNLFCLFALLDDIYQEQENIKAQEIDDRGGNDVNN